MDPLLQPSMVLPSSIEGFFNAFAESFDQLPNQYEWGTVSSIFILTGRLIMVL
jgi:hypothetical protein